MLPHGCRVGLLIAAFCANQWTLVNAKALTPMKRPEKKLEPLDSWTPGQGPMAEESCWGTDEDWNTESSAFLQVSTAADPSNPDPWGQFKTNFGPGMEWLFRMMPGMRGKLYGRSLTPPCRCEACAYTLDTLIMYLDEDTMGWYTPDDIQHIMMDRFCYGIKWLYRSACHHILTAYFDDVAAMAMGHMTGLDICRVLRFCPYYYSGGNMPWGNVKPFNFMPGML